VESKLGPLGTSAIYWPIVPGPDDCKDGEFGGMNGRGNRSTRRKPAPAPLCPPQIPLDQTRATNRLSYGAAHPDLTSTSHSLPFTNSINIWQRWRSIRQMMTHFHLSIVFVCPAPAGVMTAKLSWTYLSKKANRECISFCLFHRNFTSLLF
jgi:hypothetical protein